MLIKNLLFTFNSIFAANNIENISHGHTLGYSNGTNYNETYLTQHNNNFEDENQSNKKIDEMNQVFTNAIQNFQQMQNEVADDASNLTRHNDTQEIAKKRVKRRGGRGGGRGRRRKNKKKKFITYRKPNVRSNANTLETKNNNVLIIALTGMYCYLVNGFRRLFTTS